MAAEDSMELVLFACVHNAGRSQMAAAFFNALADRRRARAVSAGTNPAEAVHAEVVTVLREVGLDVSSSKPQKLTESLARDVSLLVTMGCGDSCPWVQGVEVRDWPLPDPKGQDLETVRDLRDDVRGRVLALIAEKGWGAS